MPCNNVTESVRVVLDGRDRLKDYTLSKQTCGLPVGRLSLLREHLRGRTVQDLLACTADDLRRELAIEDELEEFLALKHLCAIRSALEVLTGQMPGAPGSECVAAEIAHEHGDLVIDARIPVDVLTERIRACGQCGSCGKARVAGTGAAG